ncbi:MAG: DEAD/DEAH box helicase [Thermales bacterium]|nr:DEAD/DEAH box helicase [Thermales bacterium]
MILAPTRELAMQIEDEIKELAKNTSITSTIVVGGMPIYRQIERLRKPKHFIVGTTGRTLDLVNQNKIKLDSFDTIVLDEMDQMLDMGFLPDIKKILAGVRDNRHLLFFSATLDKNIESIAKEMLVDPVHISVKTGQTTDNVEQNVVRHTPEQDKFELLLDKLNEEGVSRAIIFDNTKHSVKKIEQKLLDKGHKVVAIHGNKTQSQRKKALDAFKMVKLRLCWQLMWLHVDWIFLMYHMSLTILYLKVRKTIFIE